MVVNKFAFVVRSAELGILRYKLAAIFKQAELQAERGCANGSTVYIVLLNQAEELVNKFNKKWAGDCSSEFPALSDLKALSIPPEPIKAKPIAGGIALITAVIISLAFATGAFGAVVHFAYHLFVH